MNIHTPTDLVLVKKSLNQAISAAVINGAVIDVRGFEKAMAVFNSAPSGAGTTSDCKLQEGSAADGSDMVDVPNAVFTQVTTAGGAKVETMSINLSIRKRYLRLVHTGAGANAAGQMTGTIHLFNPRYSPVTQDVTPIVV